MSDSGRHGHPRPERQKSCPAETTTSGCTSSNKDRQTSKGTGKRFARRAKRWAELQNRRNSQRSLLGPPDPPLLCDYVEMTRMGSGLLTPDENHRPKHALLSTRRSLPYSIFQPRRQELGMFYPCEGGAAASGSPSPLYVTQGLNEYGRQTFISVYQTAPELTVYPINGSGGGRSPPSRTRLTSSPALSIPSTPDSGEMLSLLTADLSATSLSSPNSSPLSTSISSQDADDYFTYPTSSFSRTRNYSDNSMFNTAPPPDRNWVMIRHADPDRAIATFTVLCYNVLCDKYATVNQYSYCPSWALNWEYRKMSIMKEIRNYEADIITLQEVETEQFRLLFQPELKALGYSGIFSPKSRAKTMNEEDRKYVDGCAIFWKSDKFEMEKEHLIEFTSVVVNKASSSQHMLNRVMPRDNIALCAVLKIKDSVYPNRRVGMSAADNVVGSPLVVCTAHIHWDPELCDVKLVQTMMLAHELHKLLEEVADKFRINPHQTPVLICGDLNSLPDSGVFEFLSRSQISRNHPDFKGFRNDNSLDMFSASNDPNTLMHSLKLESAVDTSSIPFTNYTLEFKGMIDYIFSTPQSLARLGVLGSFDPAWVAQNKILGFPHPHVPSDHIPIMAQYAVIPTSHQRSHNHQHHPPLQHGSSGNNSQQQLLFPR